MAKKHWANYQATFFFNDFRHPVSIMIREYNRYRAERAAIKEFINTGNDADSVKRMAIGRAYEIENII